MTDVRDRARRRTGEPVAMLPAEAYTSDGGAGLGAAAPVRRHLDLPGPASTSCCPRRRRRSPSAPSSVGDVAGAAGARTATRLRMFANTCRHRGHELLPDGGTSQAAQHHVPVPRVDLRPRRVADRGARASARSSASSPRSTGWSSCRSRCGTAGSSATRCTRSARREVPPFDEHLGELAGAASRRTRPERWCVGRPAHLRGRGELEGDRRELPRVLPLPADPPRAVPGDARPTRATTTTCPAPGSAARWCCATGMATMSLTGELAATPLPGRRPDDAWSTSHLLPNLLVSAHPDYVMTHRMVPLAPDRTWVECSWLALPGDDGTVPARRRRGVLGHHQPAGLGRLRVGAARAGQPALPARARSRPTRTRWRSSSR